MFPWDNEEKPYWINPENGLEWYVDKTTTEYCMRDTLNDLPKLNAVAFFVVERKDNEINPISRILIDKNDNSILADETSLEGMGCKIDLLRLQLKLGS